jgi:vancomycin permeability regulator SanA
LRRWLRARRLLPALLAVVVVAVATGADLWVRDRAHGGDYSVDTVPPAPVAVIFGAQVDNDGQPSGYLAGRLDLGARLLRAGKVRALLLTGDYGTPQYDEPDAMRRYLVQHGVPADKTALDYAGFSTYDSCARAYRIFGVRKAVLVTTDFSEPRTLALCRAVGIEVSAVVDHSQSHDATYLRGWLRDQLADTKAIYHALCKPDPKLLGRQETSVAAAIAAKD